MSNFSTRLRKIRKERKLTQKQLAIEIGASERGIQQYELGERKPAFDVLIALADFFAVSLDYLTGRSNYPDIVVLDEHGKPIIVEAMTPPEE